jgi:putative transposase
MDISMRHTHVPPAHYEIRDITRLLEQGKPLPDEYRFLLFGDKREVELVWNGKTNEVCNVVLPFQVIEQVDEPGPEFVSKVLDQWAYRNGVKLDFSRPGKPTDNAYVESFNGSPRDECLNVNWFLSLDDARGKIEAWRRHYYESRPHSALGDVAPSEFASKGGAKPALASSADPEFSLPNST